MPTKIGGFDSGPGPVSTGRAVKRGDAARSSASGAASSSSDAHITDSARKLSELEHVVQSLPAVDSSRVAEVSSSIQNGTYQVNPERIADKLLQSEKDLAKLV
ncbi:MAG: flagellar biosynthesis anti-sigma factor FlgM [Steroidobacter sp.]